MNYSFLLVGIIAACSVAEAKRSPVESWSKSGGTYAQYQVDAVECAKLGYYRDVANDQPAKAFIRGFETADQLLNLPSPIANDSWSYAVSRTQPSRKMAQVHGIQVGDVETCLLAKGYHKFTLTKAESKTVAALTKGSEARRRYLFDIGTRRRADRP